MDYKEAGVDVELGDLFVEKIKTFVGRTYNQNVVSGVGGFAALYDLGNDRLLASGTDGVGTKVKLAQELDKHDTIGQDLVAMCANDIICTGARPLFFLDYLACGKLDPRVHLEVVDGISKACQFVGMPLIGGETAEMPGVYESGIYDLAGFAVGEVFRKDLLGGAKVKPNQYLVGLASSGFHSNGYSLVRRLVKDNEEALKEQLLTPTRLYGPILKKIMQELGSELTGVAHITGGGFENIPRLNEDIGYDITNLPPESFRTDSMNEILRRADLTKEKSYQTFNMGVGLVLSCTNLEKMEELLSKMSESFIYLGKTTDHAGLCL